MRRPRDEVDGRARQGPHHRLAQPRPIGGGVRQRLARRNVRRADRRRQGVDDRAVGIHEDVVPVPKVDRIVRLQAGPQEVEQLVATRGELSLPVFRRLLVDMMLAALAGRGRRKENELAVADQAVDELVGSGFRDVLGDFQALDEVELAIELQGLGEVARQELRRRDVNPALVDVGAVDALNIRGAMLQPDRQPDAAPAAEVEDAPDRDLLGEKANDMVGRYRGGTVGRLVEAIVVGVQRSGSRRLALGGADVEMGVVRAHEPVAAMALVEQHLDSELQVEKAAALELFLERAVGKVDLPGQADDVDAFEGIDVVMDVIGRGPVPATDLQLAHARVW